MRGNDRNDEKRDELVVLGNLPTLGTDGIGVCSYVDSEPGGSFVRGITLEKLVFSPSERFLG